MNVPFLSAGVEKLVEVVTTVVNVPLDVASNVITTVGEAVKTVF